MKNEPKKLKVDEYYTGPPNEREWMIKLLCGKAMDDLKKWISNY